MQWDHPLELTGDLLRLQIAGFRDYPFVRFKSGILAPIYFNGRKIPGRRAFRTFMLQQYEINWRQYLRPFFGDDAILAGVATGGISMSGMLADRLDLDHCYVRTDKKKHGTKDLIESIDVKGRKVLVFEDVVSRAESSAPVIETLQANGAEVTCIISHFSYGFRESAEAFDRLGVRHHTLIPFTALFSEMRRQLPADHVSMIEEWYADPDAWTRTMEEQYPDLRLPQKSAA